MEKKIYFGCVQTSNFKLESGISSEGTIKNLKGRPTVQTPKVFIKEKLVLIMKTKPKLGVQISWLDWQVNFCHISVKISSFYSKIVVIGWLWPICFEQVTMQRKLKFNFSLLPLFKSLPGFNHFPFFVL